MLPLWEWPGKTSCDQLIPPLLEAPSLYVSGLYALTSLVLPLCSSLYLHSFSHNLMQVHGFKFHLHVHHSQSCAYSPDPS